MTSSDWNSGKVYAMFPSESFTIDVFTFSNFISIEQIAWKKVYAHTKIERFIYFFFFLHVTQIVTC